MKTSEYIKEAIMFIAVMTFVVIAAKYAVIPC